MRDQHGNLWATCKHCLHRFAINPAIGSVCPACGWWSCWECGEWTNRTHFKQREPGVSIMEHVGAQQ